MPRATSIHRRSREQDNPCDATLAGRSPDTSECNRTAWRTPRLPTGRGFLCEPRARRVAAGSLRRNAIRCSVEHGSRRSGDRGRAAGRRAGRSAPTLGSESHIPRRPVRPGAGTWAAKLPEGIPRLQERLSFMREPIDTLQRFLQQLEDFDGTRPSPNAAAHGLGHHDYLRARMKRVSIAYYGIRRRCLIMLRWNSRSSTAWSTLDERPCASMAGTYSYLRSF
jgi:hypothetical protein